MIHEGLINQDLFEEWMGALLRDQGTDLFRSKGVLYFKDATQKYVFQAVHMLMAGSMEGEITKDEKPCNRLIFIGRNLNRQELEAGFNKCKI